MKEEKEIKKTTPKKSSSKTNTAKKTTPKTTQKTPNKTGKSTTAKVSKASKGSNLKVVAKSTAVAKTTPKKSDPIKTTKTTTKKNPTIKTKTTSSKKSTTVSENAKNIKIKEESAAFYPKNTTKTIKNEEEKDVKIIEKEPQNSEVKENAEITENKTTLTNKIKGYELFIIAGSLALLIALVLMVNKNNTKAHCRKAVCNESGTICYTYKLDKNGNTKKTWEGSCAKNK